MKLALEKLDARSVETAWSDALSTSQRGAPPVTLTTHEGMIIERRQVAVDAPPDAIFRAFTGLGGTRGWLYLNWTWRLPRCHRPALWRRGHAARPARCR